MSQGRFNGPLRDSFTRRCPIAVDAYTVPSSRTTHADLACEIKKVCPRFYAGPCSSTVSTHAFFCVQELKCPRLFCRNIYQMFLVERSGNNFSPRKQFSSSENIEETL